MSNQSSNLRCAFIHPFLLRYPRGIERYTFNLANALAQTGVMVDLLTWRWPNPVQIDQLDQRVRLKPLPTVRYYTARVAIPYYVWCLCQQRYDFTWIFFAGYGEAEALALYRTQRFGIVLHYPYHQVPHRYHEFYRFHTARRATHVVAVSQFVADEARNVLARESIVIHHGVDSNRFQPNHTIRARIRQQLNLKPDAPVLLTVAALEERKGVQWVLHALPAVLQTFPEAVYLVVGDGPHRMALTTLAADLGVISRVRFLGAQIDSTPFFQAADISLILASGEASSLTTIESFACGLPVVAAQHRPFNELVQPEHGVLVDCKNADQISAHIIDLLGDSERRQKLGLEARQHVLSKFTWQRAAQQYTQLMQQNN